MKKPKVGRLSKWTYAVGFAALLHVAFYWAVAALYPFAKEGMSPSASRLRVDLLESVSSQMDLIDLHDPRPLLLPTRWNAANAQQVGDLVQEERSIFSEYSMAFDEAGSLFVERFGNRWQRAGDAKEVALAFDFPKLDQFGRAAQPKLEPLPQRLSFVARDSLTGETLFSEDIVYNEALALAEAGPGWTPVTLMATVADSFLVSRFVVMESSGFDLVDAQLQEIAFRLFPWKGRLPDGVYWLEIGP